MKNIILLVVVLILSSCADNKSERERLNVQVDIDNQEAQVLYALSQLEELSQDSILRLVKSKADYHITAKVDSSDLTAEAYTITLKNKQVIITGGDATGLMYALLDIKEQLITSQKISAKSEAPAMAFRAIKFNLPYDPYRASDLLRSHAELCRDTLFWHDYLDMMAENRFNKLTLWSLHPFNYMVKTDKYPEACRFSDAEMAEWQRFWKALFRMAKERGIETYMINWNIFVPMELSQAHHLSSELRDKNKHLGTGDTSEIVKDYTREVVRATIDTYPNLTGLGITLGEGMGGMTAEQREQWLLDSFIQGARMAKRKIKFIHRVPLSAGKGSGGSTSASVERMTRRTLDTLTCFDGPMNIELKFNWSHGHSTPHLVKVHGGKLSDAYWNPMPDNYYLAWMIRNEDFFVLRWGQTDFIRQHIAENNHPYVNGYYVGSETYIPAVDHFTSLTGASYKYAFERQWLFYKTWGRLLYNPQTPDQVFEEAFECRFPEKGDVLFSAQNKTSKVPLIIASWFNARWDFTLYSEGFLGFNHQEGPSVKLLSISTMIEREPMDPEYMGIKAFVAGGEVAQNGKITPLHLADSVEHFCRQALADVTHLSWDDDVDLRYEISDIKAWANMGLYFSNKLRAAFYFYKYQLTQDKKHHQQAVEWMAKGVDNWSDLVQVTKDVYDPVPVSHLSYRRKDNIFHWALVQEQVEAELEWLKQ